MSYEPLGAQAEKSRRQKLCKNRPTGTDRCIIHITKKNKREKQQDNKKTGASSTSTPSAGGKKENKQLKNTPTESNWRNGKQITDHIRQNFGKRLDYLGKFKQLDLSILNMF